MNECNIGLLNMVLSICSEAPDTQLSPSIKREVNDFISGEYTPQEKYDFIVNISKRSEEDVSKFMISLCALDEFYLRPQ